MSILSTFPAPPPAGFTTVCEKNAELLAVAKCDLEDSKAVQDVVYPEVDVSTETHKRPFLKESARSAFIEHEEESKQRLLRAWYEHGLNGVLEELSADSTCQNNYKWFSKACCQILGAVRWVSSWHGALFPHLALPSEDLVAQFSMNMNWRTSPVRHFTWHPHTAKFAVALLDDSIRVYIVRKTDLVPTLKHKLQKGVADLAWNPYSASVLAVACQTCVIVWNVDPNSLASRPSTSAAQVLTQSGHAPVTSVQWCPLGRILATASPTDTSIMVWDVAMETCIPLRRLGGGGVCHLYWSQNGSKLMSTCPSAVFRVWETKTWTCEKWAKLPGRCQTAAWDPDGNVLLFATTEEPIIYCVTFSEQPSSETKPVIGGSKTAINICDLSAVDLEVEDGTVRVGGAIQSLSWDPQGERLAVSFKEPNAGYIALFQTRMHPSLELVPCGFIQGLVGEVPNLMCFQPKYTGGSLLTVVWSSGRVAYVPLLYVSRRRLGAGVSSYQGASTNGDIKTTLFTE